MNINPEIAMQVRINSDRRMKLSKIKLLQQLLETEDKLRARIAEANRYYNIISQQMVMMDTLRHILRINGVDIDAESGHGMRNALFAVAKWYSEHKRVSTRVNNTLFVVEEFVDGQWKEITK